MSDYFAPMEPDASGNLRLSGGDGRLWVKFERKSRRNAYKSELEGRPIYEPIDYVRIQQPGERDQFVGPVTEEHRRRFPHQWQQYQREAEQTPEGTPVQLLFPNEPHIVELLLDLKVQTVEQLAQLTEGAIDRLGMDGRKYVHKAQASIDKSEALREVTKLQHELQDAKDELATMRSANADLQRRMEALEELAEDKPRKRVRPIPEPHELQNQRPSPPPPQRPDLVT